MREGVGKTRKTPEPSRRERQILDAIYRLGEATVSDVQGALEDPPSYSAVRALLRILEEKGHLSHRQDGPRYVYFPTTPREHARASAMRRVLETFFENSTEQAVAALLELRERKLSDDEIERLSNMIEQARKEGR